MCRSLLYALAFGFILSGVARAQSDESKAASGNATMSEQEMWTGFDPYHPREFVRVVECEQRRNGCNPKQQLDLIRPQGMNRGPGLIPESVNAEVDRQSKILIVFDRDMIGRLSQGLQNAGLGAFEANVSITARIGDRPVEVPGYSEVGKAEGEAQASVLSGGELRMAFSAARRGVAAGARDFSFLQTDYELPAVRPDSLKNESAERAAELLERRSELSREITTLEAEEAALLAEYGIAPGDAPGLFTAGVVVDSAGAAAYGFSDVTEARRVRSEVLQLRLEIRDRRQTEDSLKQKYETEREDSSAEEQEELAARQRALNARGEVIRRRIELLELRPRLATLLRVFGPNGSASLLRAYADVSGQDAVALRASAAEVSSAFADLAAMQLETPRSFVEAVRRMRAIELGLGEIRSAANEQVDVERVQRRLIQELADTGILLTAVDARPGDVLTITITNAPLSLTVPRVLTMRLTVREFGFTREVSDSFLFLNREGVEAEEADQFSLTGDLARDVDFEPAAGVSLTWTYRPRRNGSKLNPLFRFLEPGLGLNVSFPQFGLVERTPTEGGGTDVVVDSEIDLAVGGVLTLFNGSIILTYGAPLTSRVERNPTLAEGASVLVPSSNRYFGIGFSFFNVAERIRK